MACRTTARSSRATHVGGKTGTTLVSIPTGYALDSTIASFVGFAPVDRPRDHHAREDRPAQGRPARRHRGGAGVRAAWRRRSSPTSTSSPPTSPSLRRDRNRAVMLEAMLAACLALVVTILAGKPILTELRRRKLGDSYSRRGARILRKQGRHADDGRRHVHDRHRRSGDPVRRRPRYGPAPAAAGHAGRRLSRRLRRLPDAGRPAEADRPRARGSSS